MNEYRHHVAGFFANRGDADSTLSKLVEAANVSLLVASLLLAPLMLLGWGASIGGLIGATAGAASSAAPDTEKKEAWLSVLVRDAIAIVQTVLVVDPRTEQETATAREVIQASVGDYKDLGTR